MIRYGNSEITDVRFGAAAVEKVFYGSNLVWEKNGYTELHIGDDFIISSFCTSESNAKHIKCGFTTHGNPASSSDIAYAFDGKENNNMMSYSKDATSHAVYYAVCFPFQVMLQSVTIVDSTVTKGFTSGEIAYSTVAETGYFGSSGTGRGKYANISGRSGNGETTHTNNALTETKIRAVTVKGSTWSVTSYHREAEIKMTVLVKTSDYNAWKRQYSSDLANATIV